MPFPYYYRLGSRQKSIYRKSDSVSQIRLADPDGTAIFARDLERSLQTGSRQEAERSARRLCRRICQDLKVPSLEIRVRQKRPSGQDGELHGLYEREEGKQAVITLWMRTAQKKNVVAFKTFLRTLVHELCHHLDYELLGLADTFHTEGFFRRESDLARQLMRHADKKAAVTTTRAKGKQPEKPREKAADNIVSTKVPPKKGARQLELPLIRTHSKIDRTPT